MKRQLHVITNCDGCGMCCTGMTSPPMLIAFLGDSADDFRETSPADAAIFDALPPEPLAELRAYVEQGSRHGFPHDGPCIWFDRETKRCRHYEHRPTICRTFEMGSPDCREWRRIGGIA